MRLSLCIATLNREAYIGPTLDAILPQLTPEVEVVIVDGASRDGTPALLAGYARRHPQIVYHRETENSGVDRDFDKAVGYASGEYCWLMSDDDTLAPGAISAVLARLADGPQLVIVNSEIRDKQLRSVLKPRQLAIDSDRDYGAQDHERFFSDAGSYLSFIGAVVVQRSWWMARERAAYYGSLFIHVGVIFQQPAPNHVRLIAEPLVRIRYGNALWTSRAFDIWVFKWPGLIGSFTHFGTQARQRVSHFAPAARLRTLLWYRALGVYGQDEWSHLCSLKAGQRGHLLGGVVSRLPARIVNATLALYFFFSNRSDARMWLYDLSQASAAGGLTRWLAKRSRFPETEI